MAQSPLQRVLAVLRRRYGTPPPPAPGADPLALILWEMVAYLTDDDTRRTAFSALRDRVGLAPAAILKAPLPVLTAICRLGGPVHPGERAKRIKLVAALAIDDFDGDLSQVLSWDYAKAAGRIAASRRSASRVRIASSCCAGRMRCSDSIRTRCACSAGLATARKRRTTPGRTDPHVMPPSLTFQKRRPRLPEHRCCCANTGRRLANTPCRAVGSAPSPRHAHGTGRALPSGSARV